MSTLAATTFEEKTSADEVPVATVIAGAAKAWVQFDGTGTVAILASFNVSSITDSGTGDYIVIINSALPAANYAITGSARDEGTFGGVFGLRSATAPSTTAIPVHTFLSTSSARQDSAYISVVAHANA